MSELATAVLELYKAADALAGSAVRLGDLVREQEKSNGRPTPHLTPAAYAEQVLQGERSGRTVQRWCEDGRFGDRAYRLPDGTWMIPADARVSGGASDPPNPAGRDGNLSLRDEARRTARRGKR